MPIFTRTPVLQPGYNLATHFILVQAASLARSGCRGPWSRGRRLHCADYSDNAMLVLVLVTGWGDTLLLVRGDHHNSAAEEEEEGSR